MASKSIGSLYAELSLKDKMSHGLNKAQKSLASFGSASVKYAAAGVGVFTAAMGLGTKRALDQVDALADLSASTGVAIADLMGLGQAYKEAGLSADQSAKDINKMQDTLAKASGGGSAQLDAFARLGLDVKELMALSPVEQFQRIGDAIMQVQNQAERVSLARAIYGKSGAGLTAVFGNIEETRKSLGKMPAVAAQFADEMSRANDLIGRIPNKFDQFFVGFSSGIVGEMIPALEKLDGLDFTDAGKALGKDIAPAIREIADSLAGIDYVGVAQNIAAVTNAAVAAGKAYMTFGDALIKYHPAFMAIEKMAFKSGQANAPITDTSGNPWEKIVADNTEKSPEEKRNLFAEKEAARDKRIAQLEELASKAKYGIPDMLKAPGLDLTTKFSPEMLLHDPARPEKVQDFAPNRSFSQENVGDEYIKRGLALGNTTAGADRLQEKQTKFLEEIRDTLKKPPINKPLTF